MTIFNPQHMDPLEGPQVTTFEPLVGLSQIEARERLDQYGPNAIPEEKVRLWLVFLHKMWAPVPWMLEASIILQIFLGRYIEAGIMGVLVIFNAVISTFQENRAHNALSLLRNRLIVASRVLRDSEWQIIPGSQLVPGDIIYLRMGDLIPADLTLISGQLLLDLSTLTGESLPVESDTGASAFAGTTVLRGEATGKVTATGIKTNFGKTAELVRQAKTVGQSEKIVLKLVKNLLILNAFLVTIVFIYALISGLPMSDILPFALILLIASVPMAMPATFTLASALGASNLSKKGVLVTRLSSIEAAASMQVLCTDKTGTLTENKLTVIEIIALSSYSKADVLRLAVLASDDATQDPMDKAILDQARQDLIDTDIKTNRKKFIPFDPLTKRSEARFMENGVRMSVVKGAPQVIHSLVSEPDADLPQKVISLSSRGLRVLAIARGTKKHLHMAGLIVFEDPLRQDSAKLVSQLKDLGVRVVMLTGDGLTTAKAIAAKIGIGEKSCSGESINSPFTFDDTGCDVYAEVLPEDKYNLVKKYQKAGIIVGMTGDGVNDAPALRQAEVGVAVSNATDVAKAAASLVLTSPGLGNLVDAIETSRKIYQRMLTYTLNKIIKTIEIAFFLSFGLIFTQTFVTTPLLMVLLLFTNDFLTMSISTDRVKPSPKPNHWNMRSIILGAVLLALPILAMSFGIYWYGQTVLQLPIEKLQTLLFLMLVFTGQGTVYLIRERNHFWRSMPSKWMLIATSVDFIAVSLLAIFGILMAPIPLLLVLELLGVIAIFLFILDLIKFPLFSKLDLN
ncbi:MAG: plasma-membrane proton-efflux P-type ATPase [Anaerolineaceae bacterium]|nr:plasma-membrane proton-efflux P-type ATPase [Anaerolineaceae bacterium]